MQANNLTIVLTLKDRTPFTYRWMQYMNDMKCPYKILIADGGKDKSIEEHLLDPSNYPELIYEYIRYPHDVKLEDYLLKLENVLSLVSTKYLLNADNDDFYLIDHIPEILSFLDANDDYVGCRGQLVYIDVYNRMGDNQNNLIRGQHYLADLVESISIDCDCPFERVEALCGGMSKNDYYANWYSIYRTSAMQEIWSSIVDLRINEMLVNEMLTHILMNIRGKIEILPQPFYIRQSRTSQFGDSLVVGNEFLERCMVNNSLSAFNLAVDKLIPVNNKEERDRVLVSIATWLEVFVSNIYIKNQLKKKFFYHLTRKLKRTIFIGPLIWEIYLKLYDPSRLVKKQNVFKEIEPYVLSKFSMYANTY